MNRPLVLLMAALVSGCAFDTLNKALPYLQGQPLDAAVNALGLPNQQMQIGPYTVYVWDNRYSSTIPIYSTTRSSTTGTVGGVPVYGTTTTGTTNYVPVQYQCQIKLEVDSNNIIRRWEWAGNQGGCQYYANRVKRPLPN